MFADREDEESEDRIAVWVSPNSELQKKYQYQSQRSFQQTL